jgi:hypothetical protein
MIDQWKVSEATKGPLPDLGVDKEGYQMYPD